MYQWIEYSLVFLNGLGNQPYETLVPLGVNFDGGHYVQAGRYRGRLFGTVSQVENAFMSLGAFGARALTDTEILAIAETCTPTNTPVETRPSSEGPTQYIGPPTLTEDGRLFRDVSVTLFSA